MPRQRRRHHSKSKSRSRSHSHDKERDAKRRKVDLYESPNPKRSVSPDDASHNELQGTKATKTKMDKTNADIDKQEVVGNLCEVILGNTEPETILIDSDSADQDDTDHVTPKKAPERIEDKPSSTRRKTQTTLINFYKNESRAKTSLPKIPNDKASHISTPPSNPSEITSTTKPSETTPKRQSIPKEVRKLEQSEQKCTEANEEKGQTEATPNEDTPCIVLSESEESEVSDGTTSSNQASPLSNDEQKLKGHTTPVRIHPPKQIQKNSGSEVKHEQKEKKLPSEPIDVTSTNESSKTPKRQSTLKQLRKEEGKCGESGQNCIEPIEKNVETEATVGEKLSSVIVTEESEDSDDLTSDPTTPHSTDKRKLNVETTPLQKLTPKQMQKKLLSEKRRLQKEKEREEREKQKNEEREKKEAEKLKKKEQKQKEIEMKTKEKEERDREKEQKRKEKEEEKLKKEEERLKKLQEREEEKLKKQQEIDEKNKEKLKEDEKKQKAAAAFASFFVSKKIANSEEDKNAAEQTLAFMPFEVKSDMKLPPSRRKPLTEKEKLELSEFLENNDSSVSYLVELKSTTPRTCNKTWPCQEIEDDVTIIEDDEIVGEKICEENPKSAKMRAKFLKFRENQRPAYYGTWRKKSNVISGRKPFGKEQIFDYEVDSDDDWEEEEQGENLEVGSDDDKETEVENEDYEVDNEFFVPHGHLSDDEIDDEENSKLSPESLKQKLKLLKDAFDEDMQSKTQRIKPRFIGCIWYNRTGDNIEKTIDKYLNPLRILTNGQINIQKRQLGSEVRKKRNLPVKDIPENLMSVLLKLVHGSTDNRKALAEKFLNYIETNNAGLEISKSQVQRHIAIAAQWTKCSEVKKKLWMVKEDVAGKYNVDLVLPNS